MEANTNTSDAFTKREAAAEELYIRQEEKAKYARIPRPARPSWPAPALRPTYYKPRHGPVRTLLTLYRLLAIKEKLKQQRQHIEDLDKHMSVPHPPTHFPTYMPPDTR
jgi:hypothetical protein